jgi:spore coat protein U-like protein
MKKVTIILTGVILMTIGTLSVNAQSTATASSDASALIVKAIAITNDRALDFGTLVPTAAPGDVIITSDNTRPVITNVKYIGQATDFSSALFTATGENTYSFSLTLPLDGVVNLSYDGNDMAVKDFTSTILATGNTFPLSGIVEFGVGATLEVGANQVSGLYEGTFEVTVTYE